MKRLTCALALAIGLGGAAVAQDYSQYYTVQNPEKFEIDWAAVYEKGNQMTADTRKALPHFLDQAYGEDAKQKLDLYLPAEPVKNAPVLLFLHGGGFTEGDRAHYGYIARPFAKHGIITAVASYRLTSGGHQYPAQAEDAKQAIIWLHENVAAHGGDPKAIFVSGHSAGAILAADIGVDRTWLKNAGISPEVLKGIAPISGRYEIKAGDLDAYAPTAELKARASAVNHIIDPAPAVVISYGTREDQYRAPSELLEDKLRDKGVDVELLALEGQDHKDTVNALGAEGSTLFNAVLEMVKNAN